MKQSKRIMIISAMVLGSLLVACDDGVNDTGGTDPATNSPSGETPANSVAGEWGTTETMTKTAEGSTTVTAVKMTLTLNKDQSAMQKTEVLSMTVDGVDALAGYTDEQKATLNTVQNGSWKIEGTLVTILDGSDTEVMAGTYVAAADSFELIMGPDKTLKMVRK